MTEKLKQVVNRELSKLPKENSEAINSVDWARITAEIGGKYHFNEEELNDFQVQTFLVLIGLKDINFFEQTIEGEISLSKEKAKEISSMVFEKIFIPINDILIEKLKKSGKTSGTNYKQNINFVLSGGDYSALLQKTTPPETLIAETTQKVDLPPIGPASK